MPTDIEIARSVTPLPITEVAKNAGVDVKHLIPYGFDKAKVDYSLLNEPTDHQAKLVLVTAINPTPAGEGKTTTTIGLADGLRRRGVKSAVALREPSLGPVFGVKGGAAGGGWAQVIPMEDINLHFTGDFHAIGAANNLLAAMLDNHIQQGNQLGIDVKRITWKRVVDMNDRQLRHVIDGIGGKAQGVPREDGFDITVASEVMAILCLSTSINDLKERLGEIVVGYSFAGEPVRARDLKAQGAMAALLKDALKPNLVQTLEHTPAFVHGGPFANIAHGCNSVTATKIAMHLSDYTITEAGFGADLGAEKFLDIKCRMAGLKPDAVVIVATVRALKYNGGVPKAELNAENLEALEKGMPNLLKHVSNIKNVYKLPCVVAINAFPTDTKAELDLVEEKCKELGAIMHIHLSETKSEHDACIEKYGKTPAQWFYDLGAFDSPTLAAHCVWVTDEDIVLMKECGVSPVHCPTSNLKLGSGFARVQHMLKEGLNVGLGTDGAASNNNLNMLEELHLCSVVHNGYNQDPTIMNPNDTVRMATLNGAKIQGRTDCGGIKVGNRADIIALDFDKPHLLPAFDPLAMLCYSAQGSDVCMTMVDGRILYENGEFLTMDKERIYHDVKKALTLKPIRRSL